MSVILKFSMVLLVGLFFAGCSPSEESPQVNNTIVVPKKKDSAPLGCEKQELSLKGKSGKSSCVNPYKENLCLNAEFGFEWVLDHSAQVPFDSCFILTSKTGDLSSNEERSIYLHIDLPRQDLLDFAKWADKNKALIRSIKTWRSNLLLPESIAIGNVGPTQIILGVLNPEIMPLRSLQHLTYSIGPRYFATASDFTSYLEGKSQLGEGERFETESEEILALLALNQSGILSMNIEQALTDKGCSESCIQSSQEFSSIGGRAQLREYISYGVPYRREWIHRNENREVSSILYLNGRQPSLAITIERDSLGLAKKIEIKNRKGETIYHSTGDPASSELLASRKLNLGWEGSNLPLVGVCEEGFSHEGLDKYGAGDFLLYGPSTDKSYFGWMDGDQTRSDFWNGRLKSNFLDLHMDSQDLGDHAAQVSYALTEKKDIGLIPISTASCLKTKDALKWWPNFKRAGGKVLNLSFMDYQDPQKCKELLKSHPIFTEPDAALWVIAAGNDGASTSMECPQSLTGKENVLIVGAMDGESISPISNYGTAFVDIFSLGRHGTMRSGVTSFAAPRVARAAALISKRHPQLTPFELKMVILLSAKIQENGDLPGRSFGELDEKKSLHLAERLQVNNGNISSSLIQTYCPEAKLCKVAKRKMQIYESIKQSSWK